jgi:phosphoglycolate phosphatase
VTSFSASRIRGVLFDLDGTLVDTGPDLSNALNRLLAEEGRPPVPYKRIRHRVSAGTNAMLRLAFGATVHEQVFEDLRRRFLAFYRQDLAVASSLFTGMDQVLTRLETLGLPWGIVTNKLGWLTEPLVVALELRERARCVVSGDTTPYAKPHPAPLLHAAKLLGVEPAACVYVGDCAKDMEAARAAGMPGLGAVYGYVDPNEPPEHWGAAGLLNEPLALLAWLDAAAAGPPPREPV